MIFKKTNGFWSTLLSIIGTLLLIATYAVADGPQGIEVVLIAAMMILSIILLLLGIVSSIVAIKKKEPGTKKYLGILLPVLIVLYVILVPILMLIGFLDT